MMRKMREISQAAVKLWGLEDQMWMVGEEASELDHAIHKWNRAQRKLLKHINKKVIPRDFDSIEYESKLKEYQTHLEKKIKAVQTEAMQVTFLVDQLKVMLPGDYESILEDVLKDCTRLLGDRGVKI